MPTVLGEFEATRYETPANLLRGLESVGGWISVADRRLSFRTYDTNPRPESVDIPFAEIEDARECASFGTLHNAVLIRLRSGAEFRLVVHDPAPLLALLSARPGTRRRTRRAT